MQRIKKERDPFLDNARFILVVFVVFGHLISPLRGEADIIYWINNILASFRMPALVMISGFFAKRYYKDGYIEKITIKLFFPFILFQLFYAVFHYVVYHHQTLTITWFTPYMGMWFLLSLYCWNLLLFIFNRLRHPILLSIVIAILIGGVSEIGSDFSLMRTFVFFPFFLIGFYLKKEQLDYLKKPVLKWVSIIAISLSIFILHQFSLSESREMLLGKFSYDTIGIITIAGIIRRSVLYLVMFLGILAFLPWVPKNKTSFSSLGQRTAYVYLLHFIIIKLIGAVNVSFNVPSWLIVFSPILAIVIAVLLSSRPVMIATKPFVEGELIVKLKLIVDQLEKGIVRYGRRLKDGKV